MLDGKVLAASDRPRILFETGLPPRYYLPIEDVHADLLLPSDTESICPYKGVASYQSARANDTAVEDAAWFYPEPLPEAEKIKDHLCFHSEKVEVAAGDERI